MYIESVLITKCISRSVWCTQFLLKNIYPCTSESHSIVPDLRLFIDLYQESREVYSVLGVIHFHIISGTRVRQRHGERFTTPYISSIMLHRDSPSEASIFITDLRSKHFTWHKNFINLPSSEKSILAVSSTEKLSLGETHSARTISKDHVTQIQTFPRQWE